MVYFDGDYFNEVYLNGAYFDEGVYFDNGVYIADRVYIDGVLQNESYFLDDLVEYFPINI